MKIVIGLFCKSPIPNPSLGSPAKAKVFTCTIMILSVGRGGGSSSSVLELQRGLLVSLNPGLKAFGRLPLNRKEEEEILERHILLNITIIQASKLSKIVLVYALHVQMFM